MKTLDGFLEEVKMLARDHHDSDDCRTSNLTGVSLNKCAKIIEEMNDKLEFYFMKDQVANFNKSPDEIDLNDLKARQAFLNISKILNGEEG